MPAQLRVNTWATLLYLATIFMVVWTLVMVVAVPALVSARDDVAVLLGIFLFVTMFYALIRAALIFIDAAKHVGENHKPEDNKDEPR